MAVVNFLGVDDLVLLFRKSSAADTIAAARADSDRRSSISTRAALFCPGRSRAAPPIPDMEDIISRYNMESSARGFDALGSRFLPNEESMAAMVPIPRRVDALCIPNKSLSNMEGRRQPACINSADMRRSSMSADRREASAADEIGPLGDSPVTPESRMALMRRSCMICSWARSVRRLSVKAAAAAAVPGPSPSIDDEADDSELGAIIGMAVMPIPVIAGLGIAGGGS
jgi:hypothetical protein